MRLTGAAGRWSARLHRWLGLAIAAVVLVSALSGAALAWRDHVWRAQHPELSGATPELDDVELAAAMERLVARHPTATLRLLAPPREDLSGWQAWFNNGERALYSADAEVLLARWDEAASPFGVLHRLHIDLLAGEPGRWVMGAVGVSTALLTALGIMAWLRNPRRPRTRELVPGSVRRSSVAHRQWGVVVAAPALLLMVTGTLMSWSGLWRGHLPAAETFDVPARATSRDLLPAVRTIRRQWPDADVRFVDVSAISAGRLGARLRQPGEVHPNGRSSVTVSLSGALLERYDALTAGPVGVVDQLAYPLHSGRIDVPGWHLGVVVCGIVLAALSISGAGTWISRSSASRRRR